jgi:hypothetical protein
MQRPQPAHSLALAERLQGLVFSNARGQRQQCLGGGGRSDRHGSVLQHRWRTEVRRYETASAAWRRAGWLCKAYLIDGRFAVRSNFARFFENFVYIPSIQRPAYGA